MHILQPVAALPCMHRNANTRPGANKCDGTWQQGHLQQAACMQRCTPYSQLLPRMHHAPRS